jgi:CHAD domain-containing protein
MAIIMLSHEIETFPEAPQGANDSSFHEKAGIAFWMDQALQECDRCASDLDPDAVHNIRVALRRCRSIAADLQSFDPYRGWRQMNKEAARLFKELGELRDVQVMIEWLKNPDAPRDKTSRIMFEQLAGRQLELKKTASAAIGSFNKKKWTAWIVHLSKRAARIPLGGEAFHHLALEKLEEAHGLHRQAVRNRSHISFHRLRIGLKKFRYTLENFLPGPCQEWGADLRDLQNLLGEMHDLHVLLRMAIGIGAIRKKKPRDKWRSWIENEIHQRMSLYRRKMTGNNSLWRLWRDGLPQGEQLQLAAIKRLEAWASFRDPDCDNSRLVEQLAFQLFDGLAAQNLLGSLAAERLRAILRISAILHAVGSSAREEKHKKSYRIISKLQPPVGLPAEDFKVAALVVRYHQGRIPDSGQEDVKDLREEQLRMAMILSGILRLAVAFAILQQQEIPGFEIRKLGQALVIRAGGVDNHSETAQELNRAKHPLEIACGLPIVIRNW